MGRVTLKVQDQVIWSNHDLKVPSTFRFFMSLAKMPSAETDKKHSIYEQNAIPLAVNGPH